MKWERDEAIARSEPSGEVAKGTGGGEEEE